MVRGAFDKHDRQARTAESTRMRLMHRISLCMSFFIPIRKE